MSETSRESRRRRRILNQGSDRLAFITGRIPTLPTQSPSSPAPAPADASTESQPLISDEPNTIPTIGLRFNEAEEESDSTLLNHDPVTDPYHPEANAYISRSQTPPVPKPEHENEISSFPTSQDEHIQPPTDSSHDNISETLLQSQQQPQTEEPKLLVSPGEISSAISASRGTRLYCSVAVALLVVASYLGFSLLGTKLIKSVISFRPLYLVLLTDLSVVAAYILSGKQRGYGRSQRRPNRPSSDGDQWDTQLARTLELGLVMQSVLDAVFMDCAVYAIIVICGVSLMQT